MSKPQHHNVEPQPDEPIYAGWYCPYCTLVIYEATLNDVNDHLDEHEHSGKDINVPTKPSESQPVQEEFEKVWNHWICNYLLAPDAFDMELREEVAKDMMLEFISAQRQQAATEALNMLGRGSDLFLEWRAYVNKQYDNPKGETRVIDSFEYWLDRKLHEIREKIKNG